MTCKYCKAQKGNPHKDGCPDQFVHIPAFPRKAELEKFLEEKTILVKSKFWYKPGMYYLNHGEYDRPDYVPTRYKDGWGLKVVYHYYQNTFYAPKNKRVEYIEAVVE